MRRFATALRHLYAAKNEEPADAVSPAQSLAARRTLVSRWVALGILGAAILSVTYASHNQLLMPGPLAASHSLQTDCRSCHSNVPSGHFGWLQAVFIFPDPAKESATCLACHKTGSEKYSPHDLALQELEKRTRSFEAKTDLVNSPSLSTRISNTILPIARSTNGGIFCATCHQEHQGNEFNLNRIADDRCQTCHIAQFKSFAKDHPDFEVYPYKRRTRIIFDHSSHFGKHFPEALKEKPETQSVPNVCTDCHVPTRDKRVMGVKRFKTVCSSCHLKEIVGEQRAFGPKGIPFLTLPGIDTETLKEKGISIGKWPAESEAEITPFMAMLLGSDPGRKAMLKTVQELDLLDLSSASEGDIAAVEAFVWELKALLHELATSKASQVTKRLSRTTGFNVGSNLAAKLVATIPRDVLLSAQKEWLPGLGKELSERPDSTNVFWNTSVTPAESAPAGEAEQPKQGGSEKKKQTPQKTGLRSNQPPSVPAVRPTGRSNLLPARQADALNALQEGRRVMISTSQLELAQAQVEPDKDSWRIDAFGNLIKGNQKSATSDDSDNDTETADSNDGESDSDSEEEAASDDRSEEENQTAGLAVDAESWAEFGGWYRRDYAILYKPTGHADNFLRAWLDFSGKLHEGAEDAPAASLFGHLIHKDAQGQCVKCHSVDKGAQNTRVIGWGTSTRADKAMRLTSFLHEPHFTVLDERGCLTCHKIDDNAKYQDGYKQSNPRTFVSNFVPMKKEQCTTCHKPEASRQDCTLCHNYHANEVTSPIVRTKVPKK